MCFLRNPHLETGIQIDSSDVVAADGMITLREAIVAANQDAVADATAGTQAGSGADVIRFAPSLLGQTITLTEGELPITDSLSIEGPGADLLMIRGNDSSCIFNVDVRGTTIDVDLVGLTLSDGFASRNGGAVRSLTQNARRICFELVPNFFRILRRGHGKMHMSRSSADGVQLPIANPCMTTADILDFLSLLFSQQNGLFRHAVAAPFFEPRLRWSIAGLPFTPPTSVSRQPSSVRRPSDKKGDCIVHVPSSQISKVKTQRGQRGPSPVCCSQLARPRPVR